MQPQEVSKKVSAPGNPSPKTPDISNLLRLQEGTLRNLVCEAVGSGEVSWTHAVSGIISSISDDRNHLTDEAFRTLQVAYKEAPQTRSQILKGLIEYIDGGRAGGRDLIKALQFFNLDDEGVSLFTLFLANNNWDKHLLSGPREKICEYIAELNDRELRLLLASHLLQNKSRTYFLDWDLKQIIHNTEKDSLPQLLAGFDTSPSKDFIKAAAVAFANHPVEVLPMLSEKYLSGTFRQKMDLAYSLYMTNNSAETSRFVVSQIDATSERLLHENHSAPEPERKVGTPVKETESSNFSFLTALSKVFFGRNEDSALLSEDDDMPPSEKVDPPLNENLELFDRLTLVLRLMAQEKRSPELMSEYTFFRSEENLSYLSGDAIDTILKVIQRIEVNEFNSATHYDWQENLTDFFRDILPASKGIDAIRRVADAWDQAGIVGQKLIIDILSKCAYSIENAIRIAEKSDSAGTSADDSGISLDTENEREWEVRDIDALLNKITYLKGRLPHIAFAEGADCRLLSSRLKLLSYIPGRAEEKRMVALAAFTQPENEWTSQRVLSVLEQDEDNKPEYNKVLLEMLSRPGDFGWQAYENALKRSIESDIKQDKVLELIHKEISCPATDSHRHCAITALKRIDPALLTLPVDIKL